MKTSLKERLVKYLLRQQGWVASGEIQRIVMQNTMYTPRTTVRRLQELFESGQIECEIRKGHAFYKASQSHLNARIDEEIQKMTQTSSKENPYLKHAQFKVKLFMEGKSSEEVMA